MPDPSHIYRPTVSYDLKLIIKELDYSLDLYRVQFVTSLSSAYPVVNLTLYLDPDDVIAQNLFGSDPIKLNIKLLSEEGVPSDSLDLELMYLKSDLQLTEKSKSTEKIQKDRSMVVISTVVRNSYKIMTSLVNDVFIGQTLRQILSSLVSSTGGKLQYDSEGENKQLIDQVCIPPTTLYKIIKEYNMTSTDIFDGFLDQRFGLFNATPGVFCQYDGTVYIKNLTKKLNKDQAFTLYHLSTNVDAPELTSILNQVSTGKVFYTYDTVSTDYSGNARVGVVATTMNHVVKPNNRLYSVLQQTLKNVANKYSLTYKYLDLPIDDKIERTRFYNEDTGFNTDPILFNSRMGRVLCDLSSLSANIERNLPVLSLLNVGECVKYKPLIIEYEPLEGKYILWSSTLTFTKTGRWETVCRVNLLRTNKSLNKKG